MSHKQDCFRQPCRKVGDMSYLLLQGRNAEVSADARREGSACRERGGKAGVLPCVDGVTDA